MNNWLVIPFTKEEFVKGSLIFFWALPVVIFLTVWEFGGSIHVLDFSCDIHRFFQRHI